jgi:membrane protein implicated in regulation of membrane protease activity
VIRIVDIIVKMIYSVLLSLGAVIALVVFPPLGVLLLLFLHRFFRHEAGNSSQTH